MCGNCLPRRHATWCFTKLCGHRPVGTADLHSSAGCRWAGARSTTALRLHFVCSACSYLPVSMRSPTHLPAAAPRPGEPQCPGCVLTAGLAPAVPLVCTRSPVSSRGLSRQQSVTSLTPASAEWLNPSLPAAVWDGSRCLPAPIGLQRCWWRAEGSSAVSAAPCRRGGGRETLGGAGLWSPEGRFGGSSARVLR